MPRNLIALAVALALGLPSLAVAHTTSAATSATPASDAHGHILSEGRRQFFIATSTHSTLEQVRVASQRAITLLKPLADAGVPEANLLLARLYGAGAGVMVDRPTAIAFGRKAADAGYAPADAWMAKELRHPVARYDWQVAENRDAAHYEQMAVALASRPERPRVAPRSKSPGSVPVVPKVEPRQTTTKFVVERIGGREVVLGAASAATLPSEPVAAPAPTVAPTAHAPVAAPDGSTEALRQQLAASNRRVAELERELAALEPAQPSPPPAQPSVAPPSIDVVDLNRRAVRYIGRGDFESAVPLLRRAADAGFAPAEANLGVMYLNGTGVDQDTRQAIDLLQQAANRGNAVAACNLGRIFELGLGIHASRERAYAAYRQAEELGSPVGVRALERLGARER
ncbi:hypothetical protein [Rhodanobacter sp. FW106-PBR-LB-2-11]|uniref:hypothetical protein n=1 Tax=Rhodanobacter sp. FW106-PBR-LB-2-11 TaxID=1524463 RepID=UPI0034E3FC9F